MKYRLPEGCAAVSRAGKELTIAADGTINLTSAAAADLLPHGIELVAASKPAATGGKPGDAAPDKRTLR